MFRCTFKHKLLLWKELSAGASAVLLEGARRIGKSTIVEAFAKREYDDYMILDFARENREVQQNSGQTYYSAAQGISSEGLVNIQFGLNQRGEVMHIIICLDDDNGMLFHDRRQSQDAKLRADVLERLGEQELWMNAYSARQFADAGNARIHVSEGFLEEAGENDFCFVENQPLLPYEPRIQEVICYRWNRRYPSDVKLDLSLEGWKTAEESELAGKSHERITRTVYRREVPAECQEEQSDEQW